MTRLMVLGGGRHQLPLVERAETRGIEVVLVDYLPDAPGRTAATHPVLADATDAARAVEIAKEYAVEGVITTGTDIPIRAMAAVASTLGLPSYVTPESARSATDKEVMSRVLRDQGVAMADRTTITADDKLPDVDLPVVVKPADSQGQRGISVVRETDRLAPAVGEALSVSGSGRAVIEQFIEGPEFTANVWVDDGQAHLLMVNDRITFNPPPYVGVAFQHRHPSRAAAPMLDEVRQTTEAVMRGYGIENGPAYVQMIASENGPVVVEAAARVGGGHEAAMLERRTGWSTDDALIDLALGEKPRPPVGLDQEDHCLVNFILGSRGEVTVVPEPDLIDGMEEMSWYVQEGDRLDDVTNSLGRVGYFIAHSDSPATLTTTADSFYRSLHLKGEHGENLVLTPPPELLNSP